MIRHRLILPGLVVLALLAGSGTALAGNPSGSGQPSAECGSSGAEMEPPGFLTGGFANAEAHYAGSEGTPSLHAASDHAVAQYDVACYQVTQHH